MARVKKENTDINSEAINATVENEEVENESISTNELGNESASTLNDTQKETVTEVDSDASLTQSDTISSFVDQILRAYPSYAELYVDRKGSIFDKGTKPALRGDAILYQNPYYNK